MRWLPRLGVFGFVGLGVLLNFGGCTPRQKNEWPDKPGPKVLTSFAPIQCFVLNVAGDDATVKVLLTAEGAHHHADPPQRQLRLAAGADVLFYNGLALDDAMANKVKNACGNPKLSLVALGERIDKSTLLEGQCHHEHGHEAGEEHDHGIDMHVWLSPKNAKTMVAAIRNELKRLDPEHAAGYEARAATYLARLDQLEKDGLAMLKEKRDKKILSHHDALQYFARDFGVNIVEFIQLNEVEPSKEQLAKIVKSATESKVRVIAVEPQFNRNTAADVIRKELERAGIKATFVEVDTLEAANEADITPDFYERKMRENLKNLADALP